MPIPLDVSVLPPLGNQRVLVVVLPSPLDFVRADVENWYRVPVLRAPVQLGADFLAFYQTGAFSEAERWQIAAFAAVTRVRVATRIELIPAEPNHPRAHDAYYRIDLGPLWQLPRPIPSRRLRRVTFIPTTLARLFAAREINELWEKSHPRDRLWQALLRSSLDAELAEPWQETPDLDAFFSPEISLDDTDVS